MEMLSLKAAIRAQWAPPAQHLLPREACRADEETGNCQRLRGCQGPTLVPGSGSLPLSLSFFPCFERVSDNCAPPGRLGDEVGPLGQAWHTVCIQQVLSGAAFPRYLELERLNDVFRLKLKRPQEHLLLGGAFHAL